MNDTVRSHLIRQAGVISRPQALEAGLTPRQIDRLLRSSEWLREWPGVYRLHAAAPLPDTLARAASLWLGPDALLTDHGAVWWWGVVDEPPSVLTFAARRRRHSDRPAVCVVEAFVDPVDRTVHRGLPVVSRPWAVLRTAATWEVRQPGRGIALLDRATQLRAVRHEDLRAAFDRHPGCWGSTTIRTLLARTGDGAHSELERIAVALLRKAGITGFTPNLVTRLRSGHVVEIDIAFADRKVAIELDGFAAHSGASAFRRDRRRGNRLMADGWTVRRFTWDDLVADPDGFVATVLELLVR